MLKLALLALMFTLGPGATSQGQEYTRRQAQQTCDALAAPHCQNPQIRGGHCVAGDWRMTYVCRDGRAVRTRTDRLR
jgi:hypothetical protein